MRKYPNLIFLNPLTIMIMTMTIIARTEQKTVQLPAKFDDQPISMKIGSTKILQPDDFNVKNIMSQVVIMNSSQSNSLQIFWPCLSKAEQLQYQVIDTVIVNQIPSRPTILQSFQQIKYKKYTLDIALHKQTVYIIFKNSRITKLKLTNNNFKVQSISSIKIEGISQQFLEPGYFVIMGDEILFVNNKYLIRVEDEQAAAIGGYGRMDTFENVVVLDRGTFAVLENQYRMHFYKYQGMLVKKVGEFNSSYLIQNNNRLSLRDIAYWAQKQLLITLDTFEGVKAYKIKQNNNQNINQIQLQKTSNISNVRGCSSLFLHGSDLYINCGNMIAFDLSLYPEVTIKPNAYTNIEFKEIYSNGDLLFLINRNSFSVLYKGQNLNYIQDASLDKVIVSGNLVIQADQKMIQIAKYKLIQPYITCSTGNEMLLGTTQLLIKTVADCSQEYLLANNINPKNIGPIEQGDVCMYSLYKPIHIWKEGQITILPLLIGLLILICICILFITNQSLHRKRIIKLMQQLQELNNRNEQSDSAKYHEIQIQIQIQKQRQIKVQKNVANQIKFAASVSLSLGQLSENKNQQNANIQIQSINKIMHG